MSWAVTNLTDNTIHLDDQVIAAGASVVVEVLSPGIQRAASKGQVSYTENVGDTNGIIPQFIRLIDGRNSDGTILAAAAAAGKFGLSLTLGTSAFLVGEAAQNNTKTDIVLAEIRLPDTYVPGTDFVLTANAHYTGSGTVGTKTLDCEVFKNSSVGGSAADICATTIKTLTNAAANHAFTITGATLAAGDTFIARLTMALQETGNVSTITGRINSIKIG